MIRQARPTDVEAVIPLILVILKDMELPFIKDNGEETTLEVLRRGFLTEDYRYSYQRAVVAEEEGEVVGVAFGYPDTDEACIDEPVVEILQHLSLPTTDRLFSDLETRENEWYLDTISVRGDQRGKGIGAKLLEALPRYITHSVIALNVDKANPKAKKLYERAGFEVADELVISGHLYDHMIKKI